MKATIRRQAKVTSKGQITIPLEVRRALGVKAGDRVLFEGTEGNIQVRSARTESLFEKFRGIGNPGIPSGRKAVVAWVRELRGK